MFRDIASGFGLGGLARDGAAVVCVGDRVFVAEGHAGAVYVVEPATLGGVTTEIASGLNPSVAITFPQVEGDGQGNLVGLFGTRWWRVTPQGQATHLFDSPGGNEALVRNKVTDEYFSGDVSQQIVRIDLASGNEAALHSIAPWMGINLKVLEETGDFFYTTDEFLSFVIGGRDVLGTRATDGLALKEARTRGSPAEVA